MISEHRKATKDPYHQLCQYWELTDADEPTPRDIFENKNEGVVNYPGIVFMEDSTFLENPRASPRYGKFTYKGRSIEAKFDDGTIAEYVIQLKGPRSMKLQKIENGQISVLHLQPSEVFFAEGENPYSKAYMHWMFKPVSSETEEQIKSRLKNCVGFYKYFLKGHAESKAEEIDFTGLPSCFRWYQGGIFVQKSKALDKKWIDCFYSTEQAMHARDLMQETLLKKYDWDTTQKNWIAQLVPVLLQVEKQF